MAFSCVKKLPSSSSSSFEVRFFFRLCQKWIWLDFCYRSIESGRHSSSLSLRLTCFLCSLTYKDFETHGTHWVISSSALKLLTFFLFSFLPLFCFAWWRIFMVDPCMPFIGWLYRTFAIPFRFQMLRMRCFLPVRTVISFNEIRHFARNYSVNADFLLTRSFVSSHFASWTAKISFFLSFMRIQKLAMRRKIPLSWWILI